ncbi:MAG: SpoIIE family protein phosphatase [Planctomycetaceae bacterium]|nr:SpoIIE family protein phosphatase [Planctomycetaceae bacterium]
MDSNPNLRIHVEEDLAREERLKQRLQACCPEAKLLAEQFEITTGWQLNYGVVSPPGDLLVEHNPTPIFGRFEISDMSAKWPIGKPTVSRIECEKLLSNINRLMARIEGLELTQHQSGGTLIEANEDSPLIPTNLSDKVANLLRFAKDELNAIGAAVYLLDEATTHLRLRSMIAPMAFAPEVDSVRALENSLADLESLIGNKINIQSPEMGETWRIPKPFQYGWCVVLGTVNLPLGTIWLFFSQARTPSEKELGFIDSLNNQLYSEINSREKPQASDAESALLQQELLMAARSNDARLPSFSPEVDGWKVVGWTYRQGYLASTFHDWAITPTGNLSVALGQVGGPMLTAAMTLNNMRSLVSAHREYRHTSSSMAAKLNEQIWCQSPGDETASLIYALIDPENHRVDLVNAGDGGVVFAGPRGVQSIDQFQSPLGIDLDTAYVPWEQVLQESETIVLFSQGLRHALGESSRSANDADLVRAILLTHPGQPHSILAAIEERFFNSDFQHVAGDLSVVVLARSSQAADTHQVAAEVSQSILAELRANEGDLLEALVKRIEHPDDWDDDVAESIDEEIDAADFDQHWSHDESTFGVIDHDDADIDALPIEPQEIREVPSKNHARSAKPPASKAKRGRDQVAKRPATKSHCTKSKHRSAKSIAKSQGSASQRSKSANKPKTKSDAKTIAKPKTVGKGSRTSSKKPVASQRPAAAVAAPSKASKRVSPGKNKSKAKVSQTTGNGQNTSRTKRSVKAGQASGNSTQLDSSLMKARQATKRNVGPSTTPKSAGRQKDRSRVSTTRQKRTTRAKTKPPQSKHASKAKLGKPN